VFIHLSPDDLMLRSNDRQTNVLIDADCRARLTDFGLSSVVNAGENTTYLAMTTRRPGVVRWMAPEPVVEDTPHISPTFWSHMFLCYGSVMFQVGSHLVGILRRPSARRLCLANCRSRRSRIPPPLSSSYMKISPTTSKFIAYVLVLQLLKL